MGNSSSTGSSSPSPTTKRKRRRESGDNSNEKKESGLRSSDSVKRQSYKKARKTSQAATGRLLIKNCRIWTWNHDGLNEELPNMREDRPRRRRISGLMSPPQWLCVDFNGRINSISNSAILPDDTNFDTVIDAAGHLLLPGLIDAHLHVMLTGESAYYLDLQNCASIAEMKNMLINHQEAHPDLPWLVGVNWDQTPFGRYPSRLDLDEVAPNRPVFLWRACWHIGVANSVALERAGIDLKATEIKVEGGGEVECDAAGPTGILKESAVQLVAEAMGKKSFQDKMRFISEGLARCCKMGLTSVQTNDEYSIDVYKALMKSKIDGSLAQGGERGNQNGLPCRVFLTPVYEETLKENNNLSEGCDDDDDAVVSCTSLTTATKHERSSLLSVGKISPLLFGRTSLESDCDVNTPLEEMFVKSDFLDLASQETHLCIERVKIFGDGSLGAETAAITLIEKDKAPCTEEADSSIQQDKVVVTSSILNDTNVGGVDSLMKDSLRTVKISIPSEMEIDYLFQDCFQEYMQQYGAISQISFNSFGTGNEAGNFAEVLFKSHAGAKKCSEEWEQQNPKLGPYKLHYIGENSFGETVMSIRYEDSPTNHQPFGEYKGILTHKTKDLINMIAHCKHLGYRVEIHAIGDAAAAQAVFAIEKGGMQPSDRPVLTHCQILSGDIVRKMLNLGIIANVQPSFVPTDMRWVMDRVSAEHLQWAYPWKSLLDMGVVVAGGSDAPIESCCPFTGMHDAIFRRSRCSPTNDGEIIKDEESVDSEMQVFRPEECVNFAEALWMYTVGAAIAANCENVLGQVAKNFAADLVLVNPNIYDNLDLLLDYSPEVVIVGGQVRYINSISILQHGVKVSGNLSSCLPGPSSEVSSSVDDIKLEGPFIPGKNGRLPPPSLEQHVIGLPRGSGFCACWLRGKHCSKKNGL